MKMSEFVKIEDCAEYSIDLIEQGYPASDPQRMSAATEAFAYGEWNLDEDFTRGGRRIYDQVEPEA